MPGNSWRSTQEEGRHRGPLAGERAAWTGGLEGSTFFPECVYPSLGPGRLSSCFASVMLDSVFCVFILKLVSWSPVQFSVSSLPWRSQLGLEALVPVCVSIFGPASCLLPFYRWRGHRTPLGGQSLSLQGLELHLDSLWGGSFIHLCTDSATLSCLPLRARHGAVLRQHKDDCGPGLGGRGQGGGGWEERGNSASSGRTLRASSFTHTFLVLFFSLILS